MLVRVVFWRLSLLSANRKILLAVFWLEAVCAFCLQLTAVKKGSEHPFSWCLRGICATVRPECH